MNWKSIGMKLTAAAMTALVALQFPLRTIRVAAANPQYLSEMIISYGNTDDEAKKWLKDNGYKIVDQNLNQDAEGGSSALSWLGLASTKRSIYLGYKTTTDADKAITDMKIMNMNGGYSYQAYEKVLEETRREKEHFLNNLMAALTEYRANYKAGKTKAIIAHDNLNKFYDDDSGQYMGDLLLESLKTEDEAAWEADPKKHADMVTILMQGNSTVVSEIMQNLAFAADTAEDSWLDRALSIEYTEKPFGEEADFEGDDEFNGDDEFGNGGDDEDADTSGTMYSRNGFEALLYQYEEEYGYDEGTLAMRMVAEYDDDAKMFASSLVGLSNLLTNYTNSELSGEATKEEIDAYFEEHPFENSSLWSEARLMYDILNIVSYHGESLLNLLVYGDYDYLSNDAYLEGWEEEKLPQRALLYPFIASMSEGQRALLEYTAMNRMLSIGMMNESDWDTMQELMKEDEFSAEELEPCSVYAAVNRDDFKVGSIAVTNVAQGLEATTGEKINEGILGTGISYVTAGMFVGGLTIGITGAVVFAKNFNASSAVKQSQQVLDVIEKQPALVYAAGTEEKNAIIKAVQNQNQGFQWLMMSEAKGIDASFHVKSTAQSAKMLWTGGMTKAGADEAVAIQYQPNLIGFDRVGESMEPQTIEFSDGIVISITDYYDEKIDDRVFHIEQTYDPAKDRLKELENRVNPELLHAEDITDDVYNLAKEQLQDLDVSFVKAYNGGTQLDKFLTEKGILKITEANKGTSKLTTLTIEQHEEFIEYLKANEAPIKQVNAAQDALDARKAVDQYEKANVNNKAPEIIQENNQLADKADDAMAQGAGSTFWKYFGLGMAIVGFAMSIYSVYCAIDEMQTYYHTELLPIPRKMVDRGVDQSGNGCYIYYDCTPCNRTAMNMGNETLGDYGDLNGDVMKQWLALYTTKDSCAGKPILADFTVKTGTTDVPLGTQPLTFFGFSSGVNLVDENYVYNDKVGGIYLYYEVDTAAGYTGTVVGSGMLATTGVLSAAAGAGIFAGISALTKRKKKTAAA